MRNARRLANGHYLVTHYGEQVVREYDADGKVVDTASPNGSVENIAGICNKARNVCGMMPHPERASEEALGSANGRVVFESILKHLRGSQAQ